MTSGDPAVLNTPLRPGLLPSAGAAVPLDTDSSNYNLKSVSLLVNRNINRNQGRFFTKQHLSVINSIITEYGLILFECRIRMFKIKI